MNISPKKSRVLQIITTLVLVFLVVEVALLLRQNKELRSQLAQFVAPVQFDPLKAGDTVTAFRVKSRAGEESELGYSETTKPRLLFIYSTTCPHCEKTIPYWEELASELSSSQCSVEGICISPPEKMNEHFEKLNLNFEVAALDDTSFQRQYKMQGVPTTLALSEAGVVKGIWIGELTTARSEEIRVLMGVKASPSKSQIQ
jgi:peroxiredoxin